MAKNRNERVANLIHGEISRILREEVSDPRIGLVSITAVRVSPDLGSARIHILPLGGNVDPKPILDGLKAATGFIRKQLASSVKMRHIPQLTFVYDEGLEEAIHITHLIESLESTEE